MATHNDLKMRHELGVAQHFIDHLVTLGVALRDARAGEPARGEPDVVCDSDAGPCGIEIADGYMSEADASVLWGLVRANERDGAPPRTIVSSSDLEAHLSPIIAGPDAQLASALQATLARHCTRAYAMPTYLVLNASHAPLTSAEDAPMILAALRMPPSSAFLGVYVCLTRNFSWIREFFLVDRAPKTQT